MGRLSVWVAAANISAQLALYTDLIFCSELRILSKSLSNSPERAHRLLIASMAALRYILYVAMFIPFREMHMAVKATVTLSSPCSSSKQLSLFWSSCGRVAGNFCKSSESYTSRWSSMDRLCYYLTKYMQGENVYEVQTNLLKYCIRSQFLAGKSKIQRVTRSFLNHQEAHLHEIRKVTVISEWRFIYPCAEKSCSWHSLRILVPMKAIEKNHIEKSQNNRK